VQNLQAAATSCDYGSISLNSGKLFKRITTVQPIQTAPMLEPFNITDSPFYAVIENVYQAIRGGLLEQRETAEMTF